MKKVGGAKRVGLIVLCCVLAVVLAALLGITIVMNHMLDQIQRPEDTTLSSSEIQEILNENTVSGTVSQEETTNVAAGSTQPLDGTAPTQSLDSTTPTQPADGTKPTEEIQSKDLINILLIGQNASSAASWQNAEVMILCSINKKTKTLTMTSFSRDENVQIPGYGNNKLKAAYAIGGMKLLDQCLEENFSVQVDANIAVNYSGLMKLVDMAGGVAIRLTAEEANYLNTHGNWGVTTMGGWNLKEGENTLTGEQAMGYALIRKIGGEQERTKRQREVIAALAEQAKKLSISQLYDLVEEGLSYIATDMTNEEILGYVAELAPMLTDLKTVN